MVDIINQIYILFTQPMTVSIHPDLIPVFLSSFENIRNLSRDKLRAQGLDLSSPDYHALRLISAQPGLNQQDLGRHMGKDKALITRKIRAFEKEGLVSRQRNPSDQRSYQLFLTKTGEQLWERINAAMQASYVEFFSELDASQQNQLFNLLKHCLEQTDR